MKLTNRLFVPVFVSVCWLFLFVLALDALEFETYNTCADCTILPHISERFSTPELTQND